MTDHLLRRFAELNPVVDPDRLLAFESTDPPGDPVLQSLLDHGRTNGDPTRSTDFSDARPTPKRGTTLGETGDGPTTLVAPEGQPTVHRRSMGLSVAGVATAVTFTVIAGVIALKAPGSDPVVSATDATLYGDGDISCPNHVAVDRSLPVGTVEYRSGERQVRVIVSLTDAAPQRDYRIEMWSDETCETGTSLDRSWGPWGGDREVRITTDGNGNGSLDHVFTGIEPGTYRINVNLVTGHSPDDLLASPDDPRHREMGAATFTEVIVAGDESD